MSPLPRLAAYFTSGDSDSLVSSVRAAEAAGFDHAWFNDAHNLWQDCYVHMARTLELTDRIRIGTGVTNPVTRHFSVAASGHATLNDIYPGRVVLGIGRGDGAVHPMGLKPMSTKEFTEVAPKVRALLHGEDVETGEGGHVQLTWLKEPYTPLMLAASGPRNLRIAGAVADIVQIQVGVRPESIAWAVGHVHQGAEEAGRDPSQIEISLLCAMWVGDDIDECHDHTRWAATTAANHIEVMMKGPAGKTLPEQMTRVVEAKKAHGGSHDYDSHLDSSEAHNDFLTAQLIDDFAIAGDGATCRGRLEELAAIGVTEVAPGFYNGEEEQLALVGREIVEPAA
jgi:alkanesulfonate monooxygenase SsuD/methylene tetrahydromethanopterin reductase-like flavin-dependent oxidoreductase (luciferase family)